jgi:PIN domain nuclease of toxin-antitoxin system
MGPFDRVIVAHASANHGAFLITLDRNIRQHYTNGIW